MLQNFDVWNLNEIATYRKFEGDAFDQNCMLIIVGFEQIAMFVVFVSDFYSLSSLPSMQRI